MANEGFRGCETPCKCVDPNIPVSSVIISLVKSVRQKPPDQKDYLKPDDDDMWTLKLESPFPHYWTFGYNTNVPVVNLTTPTEFKVGFASGRFAVVYDYEYETMVTLEGHRNLIKSLSVDASGRFMLTSDGHRGNKIILWDLHQSSPIHVIYEFEDTNGPEQIWLSPCARYVVALKRTKRVQELHFYCWMSQYKDSKIMVVFDENLDPVKKLSFSLDNPEFFMVTTEKQVLFLHYVHGAKMVSPKIRVHNGEFEHNPLVGKFTDSTYLSGTHLCYSGTETGYVRLWSDLDFFDGYCEDKEISNFKNEIMHSHITTSKITVITAVDRYLVIGNDMGKIQFFTYMLVLVYWFEHDQLSSIISLSFNLRDRDSDGDRTVDPKRKKANTLFIIGRLNRKKKRQVAHWQDAKDVCYILPRNLEDEPEKFSVKDCIVCAKNDQIAYINFVNKSIEYLLENFVFEVVALECHPLRDYLVLATKSGFLYLIDYVMNQEIVRRTILPLNVTSEGSFSDRGTVRCLKYSIDGYSLACGLSNGHIVFLSPLLLDFKHILKYTDRPIRILRFSPDGNLLVACDTTNIYFIKVISSGPELLAKQKTHGRVITDVLFFVKVSGEVTCFSIGKDKNLVQYNVAKTMSDKKVTIKRAVRIEQRSDPLCLSLSPDPRKIITGKSDFKLQMINVDEMVYIDNRHSPNLKNPVNKLFMVDSASNNEYLFFTACNHIGLIKLPLENNPYKWISIHVSENKISQYVFSRDKNFVFTLSKNEGTVCMWRVMTGALEVLANNVGDEEAFKFENILGPDRDFLLQEIKDYFVYANLIHKGAMLMGLDQSCISRTVPACEVPDILRAMGCFMTNYESENKASATFGRLGSKIKPLISVIMKYVPSPQRVEDRRSEMGLHIKHVSLNMECAIRKGAPREKFKIEERVIDFSDLVELYASGREFSCVDMSAIRKAFYRICSMRTTKEMTGMADKDSRMSISRTDFVHILTSKGETMTICEALHFLRTLVDPMNNSKAKVAMEKQKLADRNEEDQSVDFVFLPETISCDYFVRNILGLDKKSHDVTETSEKQMAQEKIADESQQRAQEKYQMAELAYRHKFTELGIKAGASLVEKDPCIKFKEKPKQDP